MPDLLLELGTEELPARFLDKAIPALAKLVEQGLKEAALPAREIKSAGTPRRLAAWAGGVPERQPDRTEEKSGPSKEAAFKDGVPSKPAIKFAESMGLDVSQLTVRAIEKKGKSRDYLWASRTIEGRDAISVLSELIPEWIEHIPFAKSMRWVPGSKTRFGRPLRRITALFGDGVGSEVVPTTWAGVESGRQVEGHRFLHRELITLGHASWKAYVEALLEAKVVVDPAERRRRIEADLGKAIGEEGLERYRHLVEEVKNLVEWPVVDVGAFQDRFLQLPDIVTVEAMTGHQRYFPVTKGGKLANRFVYVANRPIHPVIRDGNERVLSARLEDSLFFFDLDQKRPLDERIDALEQIVFMDRLGSLKDRIPRIDALALEVAKAAGWVPEDAESPGTGSKITRSYGAGGRLGLAIHQAAHLARADLATEVVGEFPSLQGEMGAIYARLQGYPDEVAEGIREAYLPRGEGDDLPVSQVGMALSLADKLDTVACAWATGKKPTGSKDPFMVRRFVLGVLRILREGNLDLGFGRLLDTAVRLLPVELRSAGKHDQLLEELSDYFQGRLKVMATKDEGRDHTLTSMTLQAGSDPTNVVDFWLRLDALGELALHAQFQRLCELVQRTKNITEKNGAGVDPGDVDVERLEHPAEKALHEAIESCRGSVRTAIAERRYVEAGKTYVDALAQVTHEFFEPAPIGVFVMDEDQRLRTNRLALLKQVHALLADGFADLGEVGK